MVRALTTIVLSGRRNRPATNQLSGTARITVMAKATAESTSNWCKLLVFWMLAAAELEAAPPVLVTASRRTSR